MRILAIDPGYERLGIAVLEKGTARKHKDTLTYSDCFKTSAKLPFVARLKEIGAEIERCIAEFSPQALAIETLFFASNQKTAMRVSEVRGAILYLAAAHNLVIYEYNPLNIKIATTGYGRSTKTQIIAMIPRLVEISKHITHDDEYDAIAVGLTCLAIDGSKLHS